MCIRDRTDIPDNVYEGIGQNKAKVLHLFIRRGVAQAKFSVQEDVYKRQVAVAPFLQRPEIELVLGALDVVPAGARVDRAVAGAARGGHAVEGVAAVLHAREDIVHGGDAQHMARPALRHRVADPGASVADDAFLDRAANAHAVEVQRRDLRSRAPAQILVIRALHLSLIHIWRTR